MNENTGSLVMTENGEMVDANEITIDFQIENGILITGTTE